MKTKEEILTEFGCPDVPFDENVTMYYPAILSAMDEYATYFVEWAVNNAEMIDDGTWMLISDSSNCTTAELLTKFKERKNQ